MKRDVSVMTWDANDLGGKAITANFKSNSKANYIGYGFTMFTDDTLMSKPVKIKSSKILMQNILV